MTSATTAETGAAPALDDEYPLTPEQLADYARNGHLCVRGVCSPAEIAWYRAAINRETDKIRAEMVAPARQDTYGRAFLQMGALWERGDADVIRFVLARRFGSIAGQLMQVDGVRLYHDQALYKEGGGGLTPWHQDQQYWPLDTNTTITMWMPLVDVSKAMGTMHFASGSQLDGYLGPMPISDDSEAKFNAYCAERGFEIVNYDAMAAGDATFHSGWTLHGAPGNQSQTMREVMTIIYHPDGTRVLPDPDPQNRWNGNRKNDLKRWLPGCVPGGLADSHLNPLIWQRS